MNNNQQKKYTKKYRTFMKTIRHYYDAIEKCHEDVKEILREGPVDLTRLWFGQQPYFFIGRGMTLYCKKAEIDENGLIVVTASHNPEIAEGDIFLDWQDMSQDVITITDFMSAIYGEEDNPD